MKHNTEGRGFGVMREVRVTPRKSVAWNKPTGLGALLGATPAQINAAAEDAIAITDEEPFGKPTKRAAALRRQRELCAHRPLIQPRFSAEVARWAELAESNASPAQFIMHNVPARLRQDVVAYASR